MKKTPSGKLDNSVRAVSMLKRVLPIPGGPIRETSRIFGLNRYSRTYAISFSRPMSEVTVAGKFERGDCLGVCQGTSVTASRGMELQSPRANRRKVFCSFEGMLNISA